VVEHRPPRARVAGVAGAAQGVGAGDADLIRLDVGEPLGEQGEAVQPARHGLRGHAALLIHPFGEANSLLDAIDDLHPPLGEAGNDHVKLFEPRSTAAYRLLSIV
jgi:hypothetical protein